MFEGALLSMQGTIRLSADLWVAEDCGRRGIFLDYSPDLSEAVTCPILDFVLVFVLILVTLVRAVAIAGLFVIVRVAQAVQVIQVARIAYVSFKMPQLVVVIKIERPRHDL